MTVERPLAQSAVVTASSNPWEDDEDDSVLKNCERCRQPLDSFASSEICSSCRLSGSALGDSVPEKEKKKGFGNNKFRLEKPDLSGFKKKNGILKG